MALERFFSPADHRAIEAAVREVEARSAGEIVPYAVERSDRYLRALWSAATLGALAASLAGRPRPVDERGVGRPGGASGSRCRRPRARPWAGSRRSSVPDLRRALVPAEALAEPGSSQRATQAFVEEEVFRTRDRTGILIFLSLFEHRVVVLADRGLDGRVTPREWEEVVAGNRGGHAARPARPGARRGNPALREPGGPGSRRDRTTGTSFPVSSAWAASDARRLREPARGAVTEPPVSRRSS